MGAFRYTTNPGCRSTPLARGNRGRPGGSTLAELLNSHRGVPNRRDKPSLTERRILAWAREYYRRTGIWPTANSGTIPEAPADTWLAVDKALRRGTRGLPGRSSVASLLAAKHLKRNHLRQPTLTVQQILAWADAHFRRTGSWPYPHSGTVAETTFETWQGIATALAKGGRGLPGGSSLPALLNRHRGLYQGHNRQRPRIRVPPVPLTVKEIVRWAKAHRTRTGTWPDRDSGPVEGQAGFTWSGINTDLKHGHRGLPGGSSLARLIRNVQ